MSKKLYAERDPEQLDKDGNHYCNHVMAMTAEGLHSKSAIAAELAQRDKRITQLEAAIAKHRIGIKGIHPDYHTMYDHELWKALEGSDEL